MSWDGRSAWSGMRWGSATRMHNTIHLARVRRWSSTCISDSLIDWIRMTCWNSRILSPAWTSRILWMCPRSRRPTFICSNGSILINYQCPPPALGMLLCLLYFDPPHWIASSSLSLLSVGWLSPTALCGSALVFTFIFLFYIPIYLSLFYNIDFILQSYYLYQYILSYKKWQ